MSKLIQAQHCVSAEPWFELKIDSHSEPGKQYRVLVPYPEDGIDDLICECLSFVHRGFCRHQEEAFDLLCRWEATEGPEEQTNRQEQEHVCPRCGDETLKVSLYVD